MDRWVVVVVVVVHEICLLAFHLPIHHCIACTSCCVVDAHCLSSHARTHARPPARPHYMQAIVGT